MDQPASSDAPHGRPRSRLRELNIILGSAVLVALLLRMFVLDAYHIPTSSMEPALMAGDFLLVNKLTFGPRTPASVPLLDIQLPVARLPAFEHPRRGDVMLLELPEGWSHQGRTLRPGKFVKRVAGVPGDTLTSAGGELAVSDGAPHARQRGTMHRTASSSRARERRYRSRAPTAIYGKQWRGGRAPS